MKTLPKKLLAWIVFFLTTVMLNATPFKRDVQSTQELLMKGAKPLKHDAYLCSGYPITDNEAYIYKFEALANAETAHHMLVYGCDGEAYSTEDVWNCPAICKGGQSILFAWAKNAPPTVLPTDVGFRIGTSTTVKTIVVQVHYAKQFQEEDQEDYSGIKIYKTEDRPKYVAGIFLLVSGWFQIPPGDPSYPVDVSCIYSKKNKMYPFAYRTHAHGLGKVITGYVYNTSYHLIGKGNPQWPQAFYPVNGTVEVKPGDALAARCTYDSTDMQEQVSVGATNNDEMCNFYIMFYTDSSDLNPGSQCLNNQIKYLTGENFPSDVSEPLPPNPLLEEHASGHHHHHGSMVGSQHEKANDGQGEVDQGGEVHIGTEQPETIDVTKTTKTTTFINPTIVDDHVQQKSGIDYPLKVNSTWKIDQQIGQVGGLSVDRNGYLYIFHRASRTWNEQSFDMSNNFQFQNQPIRKDTILVLNRNGDQVRSFGSGTYFMPHGIQVDDKDNIWITDVALHQVFKIPAGDTKPSLTLGRRFQHGEQLGLFCKPTDVAVLSTGEFFVSDGYCNARIVKYAADGTIIRSWGEKDVFIPQRALSPPPNRFDIPHSITVSEDDNLLCVADRENGRISCFDFEGNFKILIKKKEFGTRLFAVEYCPMHGGVLYAVNGPGFGINGITTQGFTLDIKTGDLLETWNVPGSLKSPHDVAVDHEGHSVYVGELDHSVWKLTRLGAKQEDAAKNKLPMTDPDNIPKEDTHYSVIKPATSGKPLDPESSAKVSVDVESVVLISKNNSLVAKSLPEEEDEKIMTPSVIVGIMLVIPVLLLLVVTLVVRANKSSTLKTLSCWEGKNKKVISLQKFLGNSHKGFDPLRTDDSDQDFDDSDQEEYSAPPRLIGKA